MELKKFEAQIIAVLADNKGHCNWEFADLIFERQKGRSKKVLQTMEERKLIYRGNFRKTTNPKMQGKEYPEVPYFIHPDFTDYERQGQVQIKKGFDLISSVLDDLVREYESAGKKYRDDLDSHLNEYMLTEKSLKSSDVDLSSKRAKIFDLERDRKNRDAESIRSMRNEQQKMLDLQERLLNSTFADGIFKRCEFMKVYQVLKKHLSTEEFRTLASRTMLTKPFTVAEYAKIPGELKEYFDNSYHQTLMPYLGRPNLITILEDFDPSISVKFCRDNLRDDLVKIYRDEAGSIGSETADFIGLDMHLSPLTSYPLNYPVSLLLQRPFERLYNDVYIFSEGDLEKLVERAYIFYSRFPEILALATRYDINEELELITEQESRRQCQESVNSESPGEARDDRFDLLLRFEKKHLETFARQAIFYWNVTSYKLDWVISSLEHSWQDGSEVEYYIQITQEGMNIKDLKNKFMSESTTLMDSMLFNGNFLCESGDLFGELRPCSCFEKTGSNGRAVSADEIIFRFKSCFEI